MKVEEFLPKSLTIYLKVYKGNQSSREEVVFADN